MFVKGAARAREIALFCAAFEFALVCCKRACGDGFFGCAQEVAPKDRKLSSEALSCAAAVVLEAEVFECCEIVLKGDLCAGLFVFGLQAK